LIADFINGIDPKRTWMRDIDADQPCLEGAWSIGGAQAVEHALERPRNRRDKAIKWFISLAVRGTMAAQKKECGRGDLR